MKSYRFFSLDKVRESRARNTANTFRLTSRRTSSGVCRTRSAHTSITFHIASSSIWSSYSGFSAWNMQTMKLRRRMSQYCFTLVLHQFYQLQIRQSTGFHVLSGLETLMEMLQNPLTRLNVQIRDTVLSSAPHYFEGHCDVFLQQGSRQILRIKESGRLRNVIVFHNLKSTSLTLSWVGRLSDRCQVYRYFYPCRPSLHETWKERLRFPSPGYLCK